MIKNKYLKIYPVSLIFCAVFIFYFFGKKEESSKEVYIGLRDYILEGFLVELPEINKKLPHKIDKETTLISIKYENNKILSVYELASQGVNREFLEKIEPAIKKQECDDDMKKKFLDVDIDFLNRYQNSMGGVIYEILVNSSICSKI